MEHGNEQMKTLGVFVLELTAYLGLCGLISILMGVPALWTMIGVVMLVDLGVILFLSKGSGEPPAPRLVRHLQPRFN